MVPLIPAELEFRETIEVIDIIYDNHHLCTQFRTDGINEMSCGLSGGKQVTKFANSRNCG